MKESYFLGVSGFCKKVIFKWQPDGSMRASHVMVRGSRAPGKEKGTFKAPEVGVCLGAHRAAGSSLTEEGEQGGDEEVTGLNKMVGG